MKLLMTKNNEKSRSHKPIRMKQDIYYWSLNDFRLGKPIFVICIKSLKATYFILVF